MRGHRLDGHPDLATLDRFAPDGAPGKNQESDDCREGGFHASAILAPVRPILKTQKPHP
jgi:hypothetical protein